jgi:hypothetical protein
VEAKELFGQFTYVNACGKKQGITRKEEADKQSRLRKNNEEQEIQSTIVNDPLNELLNKAALEQIYAE